MVLQSFQKEIINCEKQLKSAFWKMIANHSSNLFTLLDLHFDMVVLLVFLRQDESLDSPCLASVGER